MKIAISSTQGTLDAPVDERFGRAAGFIIYDTETKEHSAVDNVQNLNAPQGAGIQAAQNVANAGVEFVITGHCGPKAMRTPTAAGVKVITGASGTVSDMIERFEAGELTATSTADVEGHWA